MQETPVRGPFVQDYDEEEEEDDDDDNPFNEDSSTDKIVVDTCPLTPEVELLNKLQERDRMLTQTDETLVKYMEALKRQDDLLQKSSR